MDREQFYRGWLLLISQPWGKLYQERMDMTNEQRATVQIQQELYYKRLSWSNPLIWESVCEWYASGDHWPSIDELKKTVAANSPQQKPEKAFEPNWSHAPEPIAVMMAYAKREGVTIRDAALTVLPRWLTTNADHVDRDDVATFIESAQGYFGVGGARRT